MNATSGGLLPLPIIINQREMYFALIVDIKTKLKI
jgi:hypothetical protein